MPRPIAVLEMDSGRRIQCELFPDAAPNTVNSFLYLAKLGCYDHHAMERLAPDFVADMSYTAFHKPYAKYLIPYETRDAGFPNPLGAVPGTIVMGGYDQGISGGEFFFPFVEKAHITWHYPAFGRIVEGIDEVMRWNTLPVHRVDFPLDPNVVITAPDNPPVILRVRVETFGVDYPEPERLVGVPLPENWA